MATTKMTVITLENLALYNSNIMSYIDATDAKSIKTVAIDGNVLKFYRVEEPVGETEPAYQIELPETDISNLLEKFEAATAGNVVTVAEDGKNIVDSGIKAADLALKSEVEAVDAKADANTEAINAINDETTGILAQAKADATEKANAVQASVDVLDDKVGTVPEGSTVMGIIQNIQENAYDDTELRGLISSLDTNKADKTQVATDIETAVKAEEDARKEAVQAIQDSVGELAGTHTTDKAALEAAIALKADQTALDAVSAVANAAATKTALQEEVNRAIGEEARIESLVTAEAERAAGVEESLQTQINTIMNNPDAEGAINSINEFTKYVEEHGEIAEAFRVDINANAQAIEDLSAEVAGTYETKEDATAKYDEVKALVNEKAVQSDWSQNDETAADYIKNRTHYEDVSYEVLLEETEVVTTLDEYGSYSSTRLNDMLSRSIADANENLLIVFDGETYECEYRQIERYAWGAGDETLSGDNEPFLFHYVQGGTNDIKLYTTEAGTYTLKVVCLDNTTTTVKQLDEKFIPDTIARVADVEDLVGRMDTAEGAIDAVEGRLDVVEPKVDELVEKMDVVEAAVATKAEAQDLTDAITTLNGVDAGLDARLQLVEAQLGDGENSVSDLIDTAKQEAIDAAAEDATTKANAAEENAKKHATDLNDAMNARVEALEAIDHDHSNLELLETYTQTEADLADAVAKKHEHENADVLDGITAEKVAAWDSAEADAIAHADGLNTAMVEKTDATNEVVAGIDERVAALESVKYTFATEEQIKSLFPTA